MRECDSGNAGYGMRFGSDEQLDLVEVKVITRKMDGLDVPKTIALPNGRVRQVDRILGSKRVINPFSGLRYAVRIGGWHTVVLLRNDGLWFAEKESR